MMSEVAKCQKRSRRAEPERDAIIVPRHSTPATVTSLLRRRQGCRAESELESASMALGASAGGACWWWRSGLLLYLLMLFLWRLWFDLNFLEWLACQVGPLIDIEKKELPRLSCILKHLGI